MRISYDEFRFYIYDMLGSNKADSWGDLKVPALRSISNLHQSVRHDVNMFCWIVRAGCSVVQSFAYFSNAQGALSFNGAKHQNAMWMVVSMTCSSWEQQRYMI